MESKPLVYDQIHNAPFIQQCTHIWSDDVSRSIKSGVWDYYVQISNEFNKPLVNETNVSKTAVIFVGMCHILEEVFDKLPKDGSYIIIHRTNDRPYTQRMQGFKPKSVKYVYTVDCQVNEPNTFAIPFGNSSINGEDPFVKEIAKEPKRHADKSIFVCYNTNPSTPHRNASIPAMKEKDFAFVYELEYPHKQMENKEFYRNVRSHKYTMALAGCGADASRQWAAIQLGSIPVVTDCPEMRHFEDLPLIYCPHDFKDLTLEWLDSHDMSKRSTDRMRASYWIEHINQRKQTL